MARPQAVGERGEVVAQTAPPSCRPPRRPALYGLKIHRGIGVSRRNRCKALRIIRRFPEIDVNGRSRVLRTGFRRHRFVWLSFAVPVQ